jgi:hypothetical protein
VSLVSRAQLDSLLEALVRVASGTCQSAEFGQLINSSYIGLTSLSIQLGLTPVVGKHVFLRPPAEALPRFTWIQDIDGWRWCVEMLHGFGDTPAHHYLSDDENDDALIEVSFLEDGA